MLFWIFSLLYLSMFCSDGYKLVFCLRLYYFDGMGSMTCLTVDRSSSKHLWSLVIWDQHGKSRTKSVFTIKRMNLWHFKIMKFRWKLFWHFLSSCKSQQLLPKPVAISPDVQKNCGVPHYSRDLQGCFWDILQLKSRRSSLVTAVKWWFVCIKP